MESSSWLSKYPGLDPGMFRMNNAVVLHKMENDLAINYTIFRGIIHVHPNVVQIYHNQLLVNLIDFH